ncbi:hypothetical protein NG819_15300 [Pseudarthrobacter sp. Fe7]|nr:hypothetical protein NG819_15300 [Pseudarthrobacter sp. Fe7]
MEPTPPRRPLKTALIAAEPAGPAAAVTDRLLECGPGVVAAVDPGPGHCPAWGGEQARLPGPRRGSEAAVHRPPRRRHRPRG